MKVVNILYCYFVHGVDRTKADFEVIQKKTEEIFQNTFNHQEDADVKNLIYGYCSTSHTGSKSRDHLCVTSKNDFIEFGEYLEKTILKELQEKYNWEGEGIQCNIYISITGHSLGGVICRGLIKNIYSTYSPKEGEENVQYDSYPDYLKKTYPFLTTIQPCSFLTLSSPHLGARVAEPGKAKSILKKLEKFASRVSTDYLMSYVGKELAFRDDRIKNNEYYEKKQQPVLFQFCDKDYMDALAQFPNRTLTGFLRYDVQVKYCTAFACLENYMKDWKEEKDTNVFDEKAVGTKIIAISGYQEGEEWEEYKKFLYNEQVLKDFYYQDTRILEPPNIDEQIKNNLIRNGENPEEISEEDLNKRFLTDNENQCDIPVYALKHFNSIPFRRVSIDLSLPSGMDRLGTHGQCLGSKWTMFDREFKEISGKTVNFYGSLLVTDFIRTSKQQENHAIHQQADN